MILNRKNNILICPLEWGLGHAGRMVPVAKKLLEGNNNVFIGAGEEHRSLFKNELNGLSYIDFPGFRPRYSRVFPQYIILLLKTPLLLCHIIKEHIALKRIIRDHKIDIVISDNRFGLWSRSVKTVYITHLPLIPLPPKLHSLEWIGIVLHRFIIKKYTYCFIPDLPGELNVSGRLSHGIKLPGNVRFIGILSRFTECDPSRTGTGLDFLHNTIILSGPEPQKGILRQKLTEILKDQKIPNVILEGRPGGTKEVVRSGNNISCSHLCTNEMAEVISGSGSIVCRSGYTTIMELISLNRSALIIPTPGQTEQEYLAHYLSGKGWFSTVSQKDLGPGLILPASKVSGSNEIVLKSKELLDLALRELSGQ